MNQTAKFSRSQPYLIIFGIVFVIFAFSSNRAWVYNRVGSDGIHRVAAYPKNVPFMWQYDADAMEFFQAAAFFPDYYRTHPALVGRPLLPLLSYAVGNGLLSLVEPLLGKRLEQFLYKGSGASFDATQTMTKRGIADTSQKEFLLPYLKALIGFITVKIAFFTLSGWLMFRLVSRYTDQSVALFATTLLLFSPYAVRSIATYHTYEFQILTPIIVLFLFQNLCETYSLKRNVCYSIVVGILMLGKANYAAYLAVFVFAGLFMKPRSIVYIGLVVSGVVHILPWAAWTAFIEFNGMSVIGLISLPDPQVLAIHPADIIGRKLMGLQLTSAVGASGVHAQPGVDLINNVVSQGPLGILIIIKNNIIHSAANFLTLFGALALVGIFLSKPTLHRQIYLFMAIFFLATWIQAFVSFPYGPKSRALFDVNFILFSLSSFTVLYIARNYFRFRKIIFLTLFLGIYVGHSFLSFVKLPWVHPYDQVAVSVADPGTLPTANKKRHVNERMPRYRYNLSG